MSGRAGQLRSSQRRSTSAATVDHPKGNLSTLSGRVVPYGSVTDIGTFTEEFQRGAFRDSLAITPNVPLLKYHDDQSDPIGVATGWDDAADGLHGTFQLDGSPRAQEAARLVAGGFLVFMSIRFQPDDLLWTNDYAHVIHRRARLLEVSLVTTPAYALATVTGVRVADELSSLVRDLGAPAMRSAVTGDAAQILRAAELVRLVVEEHGTGAAAELDGIASAAKDPALSLNLARAAMVLHDAPDGAHRVHLDRWRGELNRLRSADVEPLGGQATRRRRRR